MVEGLSGDGDSQVQAQSVGEAAITTQQSFRSTSDAPRNRWRTTLGAILVLGLAMRVGWMATQAPVINSDGGEYAMMAEHLVRQHALIGSYEGPEILYAPLYPVLIAAAMLIVRNSETAAHVISLISGTALIAIVFLLAQRVYGRPVAYISAALVAFHPLLIALSGSVYNEALYVTLWLATVCCAQRALDLQHRRDSLVLGVCVGLLYLSRVEAAAYVAFLAAALTIVGVLRKQVRTASTHAALMCIAFMLLAAPYVAFFYVHTHHVRFEAKWDINYTMLRNRLAGMNGAEAAWGLADDLTVKGPLLAPIEFVDFTPYSHRLTEQFGSLISVARRNAQDVYHTLLGHHIASPVVLALLIVGWCRQAWSNRRLKDEALLFGFAASIIVVTLTSATAEERYLFPIVPILLLWSSNGLRELAGWIGGWELMSDQGVRADRIAAAVQFAAAAILVGLAIGAERRDGNFAWSRSLEASAARDAGLWLAKQSTKSKRIAVNGWPVVPYYAKGTMIAFPYGNQDAILQHISKKAVDFIVLDSAEAHVLPMIGEWISHGIPDPHPRLVYDKTSSPDVRFVIYQWVQSP
jgi:4-amino-4-deoxy-L-arabinose transferase-like glycosyltransferase